MIASYYILLYVIIVPKSLLCTAAWVVFPRELRFPSKKQLPDADVFKTFQLPTLLKSLLLLVKNKCSVNSTR